MSTTLYGIKNCDTMKKAFKWLEANNINYEFHDYKKSGLPEDLAKDWLASEGWEQIINKRGTTWRKLDDDVKNSMNDTQALAVMLDNPSIIKRPLMIKDGEITLGFKDADYQTIFS
jgi:Spx/MgsR family transcriptional regulator